MPTPKKIAFGGVVFDPTGRVLLREPRDHFDGYIWTFAKGRPEPGECPEATAVREVYEETGIQAHILAPIPGEFPGGTTLNRYFLMVTDDPTAPLPKDCPETSAICWVKPDEAQGLIEQTSNKQGRKRDLCVLEAGLKAWNTLDR